MQKRKRRLEFEVDKLTRSIENTLTGKNFETEFFRLTTDDLPTLQSLNWTFNWAIELDDLARKVYALTTK